MYKRTTGKRQWNTCEHGSIWCHDLWNINPCRVASQCHTYTVSRDIIDRHSLSCNELLTLFESLGKNFSVGNPLIVNPSTSFRWSPYLAMMYIVVHILEVLSKIVPDRTSYLQWPHHGASEMRGHTQCWTAHDMGQQQHKIEDTHRIIQRHTNFQVFSLITSDLVEVLADQYLHWFVSDWSQSSGISSVFRWGCTGEYEILSVLAILHYLLTLASVLSTNNIALSHVYMCTVQNVSTKLSTNK